MEFTFVLPTIIKESTRVFIQYVRTYIIFSHMHSLPLPLCGAALRTWVTFCAIDRLNQQSYVRTYVRPNPASSKAFSAFYIRHRHCRRRHQSAFS